MERAQQMGADTVVNPFEDGALEQLMDLTTELGPTQHWIVRVRSRHIACVLMRLVGVERSPLSDNAERRHHFELVQIALLKDCS